MRLVAPTEHGELLTHPAYETWEARARANAERAESWDFPVAGQPFGAVRAAARREATAAGAALSRRLGLFVPEMPAEPPLILVTGHQPEIYHPGIWVKPLLLQRVAQRSGAVAVNLMVDSDEFGALGVQAPTLEPNLRRTRPILAWDEGCFATTPVPEAGELARFRDETLAALRTLPNPAVAGNFARFAAHLEEAVPASRNLAELITRARRAYERPLGSSYLELSIIAQGRGAAFHSFFLDLALRIDTFWPLYNEELESYRQRNRTRSSARPFPNLDREGDLYELPFWYLDGVGRSSLWVRKDGGHLDLFAGGRRLIRLGPQPCDAVAQLGAAGLSLAPKAVTLTLFNRLFVADLFLHGVGGGRYDHVTDALIESFYGVEPPSYAVTSMTMYLPLGMRVVSEGDVDAAVLRLGRIRHNPDEFVDEVTFDDAGVRRRAHELTLEKTRLTAEIELPNADRKSLGIRIREVNRELFGLLGPLVDELEGEIERLRIRRNASAILTDRTYPFCYWSPAEVAATLDSLDS